MSAIAEFIRLPKTALEGLRSSATTKRKLFGGTSNNFPEYLRKHGKEEAEYRWSGWVFSTLLAYLDEQHQIDLTHSELDDLAGFLNDSVGPSNFFLTYSHRQAYLSKLEGEFSEDALRDYFNEFNEANESEIGEPMLDGIRAVRECLSKLDDQSVVLFHIG